jgi:hypothetical protein
VGEYRREFGSSAAVQILDYLLPWIVTESREKSRGSDIRELGVVRLPTTVAVVADLALPFELGSRRRECLIESVLSVASHLYSLVYHL